MYVYRVGVGVDLYNELLRKSGGEGYLKLLKKLNPLKKLKL